MKGNKRNRPPKNHHRPAVLPSFTEFFLLFVFFFADVTGFFFTEFSGEETTERRNETKQKTAALVTYQSTESLSFPLKAPAGQWRRSEKRTSTTATAPFHWSFHEPLAGCFCGRTKKSFATASARRRPTKISDQLAPFP